MLVKKIKNFLSETEAATAVEYAVLLMLIAGACIVAIQSVGGSGGAFWDDNSDQVQKALTR